MIPHHIRCEVVAVDTGSGICSGMAKTKKGEVYIIDGRTPGTPGICCQAFTAMSPFRMAMMVTEKLNNEIDGHIDLSCPHGVTTFRLSRVN